MLTLVGCDDGRWRDMRPAGLGLAIAMPCQPQRAEREIDLAGRRQRMAMWSCEATGWTYAVAQVVAADPAQVDALMEALLQSARSRLGGQGQIDEPATVAGMTPHPSARRLHRAGAMPDGTQRQMRTVVFRYGLMVFQATAIGASEGGATADPFFDSLRVVP